MKSIFQKSKYFVIFLVGLIIISAQIVRANDEIFQNNLLKVDVHKTSQGDVKVILYTTKPYKESVVVNQKANNEYVILMPETSNSLTAKPSLKSADVVKNIEVKTQQYSVNQGQKGYTKIIFSTQVPVEIIPQTQTLSASETPINEQDFKELMSQTAKKPAQTVVIPSKHAAPPRPTLGKNRAVKLSQALNNSQQARGKEAGMQRGIAKEKREKEKGKREPITPSPYKPINQQLTAHSSQLTTAVPAPTVAEKPVAAPAKPLSAPTVQPVNQISQPSNLPTFQPSTEVPQGRFQTYKIFVKTHLYEVLAGLLIPLIVALLLLKGARKTISNLNEQKDTFTTHLDEKPEPVKDYSEIINDDMNWKEKYQSFVEAENEPQTPPEPSEQQPTQEKSDLDSLFQDEPQEVSEVEEIEEVAEIDEIDSWGDAGFESLGLGGTFSDKEENEISLDDLFKDEFEPQVEPQIEQPMEPQVEPEAEDLPEIEQVAAFEEPIIQETAQEEVVLSQVEIEDGKGFYLVDYEGATVLAGNIGEEIFVLKKFDTSVQGKLQARLNENRGFANDYLVRLNGYKAMVEVSKDSMNLLIEL